MNFLPKFAFLRILPFAIMPLRVSAFPSFHHIALDFRPLHRISLHKKSIGKMKKAGAKTDFGAQRRAELVRTFYKLITGRCEWKMEEVMAEVVRMPASRFWVSQERAVAVVSALLRGEPALVGMRPTKARMFAEIARRVAQVRAARPDRPLCHIVSDVLSEPAPEYYMEAHTARALLYKRAQ